MIAERAERGGTDFVGGVKVWHIVLLEKKCQSLSIEDDGLGNAIAWALRVMRDLTGIGTARGILEAALEPRKEV